MKTVNDLLKTQRKPSKRRDTIVFDESARKSYVTGFKKRKDERREQARKENEEKARKAKIEARKERRQAMQYALSGGIVNRTADEDEDEEPAAEPEKMQPLFKKRTVFQNTLTTTTVTALHDSSDATFLTHTAEASGSEARGGRAHQSRRATAARGRANQRASQRAAPRAERGAERSGGKGAQGRKGPRKVGAAASSNSEHVPGVPA
jgi:ribosomal RNA-processing protein 17